jgi:hypothetical protein
VLSVGKSGHLLIALLRGKILVESMARRLAEDGMAMLVSKLAVPNLELADNAVRNLTAQLKYPAL